MRVLLERDRGRKNQRGPQKPEVFVGSYTWLLSDQIHTLRWKVQGRKLREETEG